MSAKRRLDAPSLLSLTEDLLVEIGSLLDDWDVCCMELANKRVSDAMSRPNRTWPRERRLDLTTSSKLVLRTPEAIRWFRKRVIRYTHIVCSTYEGAMLSARTYPARRGFYKWIPSCTMPPLLPSLLAGCTPSAKLSLHVQHSQGGKFLAMASGSIAHAGKELFSFSTNLRQHLTELSLKLHQEEVKAQHLEALNMLKALQKLDLGSLGDLAGQKLVLKLPHLVSLLMGGFEQGGVVLSCPKLADVFCEGTKSVQLEVEGASVNTLTLNYCKDLRLILHSYEDQLHNLEYLRVVDCSEIGKRLIEDVCQMTQLWSLEYKYFPEACMPPIFPRSLQYLELVPLYWAQDLPRGIKQLFALTYLHFSILSNPPSWVILRPLCELLPINCLKELELGSWCYDSSKDLEALGLWSRSAS